MKTPIDCVEMNMMQFDNIFFRHRLLLVTQYKSCSVWRPSFLWFVVLLIFTNQLSSSNKGRTRVWLIGIGCGSRYTKQWNRALTPSRAVIILWTQPTSTSATQIFLIIICVIKHNRCLFLIHLRNEVALSFKKKLSPVADMQKS